MKKQVLSLFMAFVLSFSMLPMSAFAGGETGSTKISMNDGETVTGGDAGKNAAGGVYQENDTIPGGGIYDPGDVTGGVSVMSVEGGEHTGHCICGGSETVNGHTHDTTSPEWTEWTETDSLPSSEGSYYLRQSVTSDWTVPEGDFKLCLNGQTFFGSITISTGATLTLTDCTGNGKLQGGVLVNGGTFELYGGTITGGVQVGINGGTYQTGSTFTMYGGSISGNTVASGSGGGVFLVGTTNQTDPPRFTMHGGTISNNTAGDPSGGGGGVYVGEKCSFTMDGGTITGNTATGCNGGGIYIHMYSTVNISGGEITKNTANGSGVISYGGGIYSESALTVSNATITENTADAGGGIYGKGSITLTDATVTGNNSYDIYLGAEESAKAYLKVSGLVNIGYYANYAWKLPIYVSDALDADSVIRVGVYDGLKPDVGGKLTIAEPADGVTLNAENFKADAVDCVTGLDENGTVYLALCEHVMDDTGYTCSECGVTLDARVGENAYYQTLAKAFDATKGDTVTLLRDVTLNANCSAASIYDTTLDLNGKSISGANYRVTVGGGNKAGTLTIKNSDANSGAQALNAKFLVSSNGKLAVDSSYTGDIACVELQAGGTLERLGGKIEELILGTKTSSATSTDYNVTLWNGNASYCTIGNISLNSNADQTLTVEDLLKTNHAKCELYGEKDGTWSAIGKTTKIAELNGYTAYRVQFQECEHQCSDESKPVCSICGKALVVKATATAADGTAKTAYFTADSTLENGYVEAVQTLNNWSSEGCKDATLMPLCNVHNGTGGIGIASVTLTGTLAVDGGEHRIYSTIVEAGADVTFKSGQYNHITVNGKAVFMGGTYLSGVNVAEGAEAVFSGGEYQSLTVKEGGTAVVKDSAAFQDDVEIRGTLNVEDGSFDKQVHVETGCTLNVSGGVFTGTGYKNVTYESGSYGTISGGTFTDLLIRGDTVRLSGGTFTTLSTYSSDVFSSLLTDNAAYYNIADNTIIENPSGNKLENVFVQTHEHNVDENGICSICQKQMTVSLTIGDDTSWYTTFEAVIDAANAADGVKIIKLYKEVNENVNSKATTYELINGPVTLETGEKTIQYVTLIAKGIALEITGIGKGSNGSKFYVTSDGTGATVTVRDSQTIITSITAQNGGKLLLSDGTYASLEVMDDGSSAELNGGTYSTIYGTAGSHVLPYALLAKGYGYKDNKNHWVIANVMNRGMENVTVEKAPIDLNIKIYPNDKTDFEDTLFNASVGSTVKLTATIGSGDDVIYDWRYLDSNKQWQGISGLSGVTYSYGEATFTINDLPDGGYQFAVFVKISSGENADYGCYSEPFTISTGPCDHVWDTDGKCTKCDEECIHPLGYEDGKCMICGYQCPHKMAGSADGQSWYCATCDLEVVVRVKTADGSFTHGTDLATALNEAADGTTVKLLTDTSLSQMVFICGADDNSNKTVTLDLSGHEFTGGSIFNIGTTAPYNNYGDCYYYPGTLKIIGEGNIKLTYALSVKATGALDLSEWKGGTIHGVSLQWNSKLANPEPSLIVGEKAGNIELLVFGNWQSSETKNIKLSGGSYGEIWLNDFDDNLRLQLHDALADGYAFQNSDGTYVSCTETLAHQGKIYDVSVVKCPHSGTSGISEDGKCACGQVQFVAQITGAAGTTVYYATLTDAAKALADGDILKLLVDADSDVIIDKAVTVDLNSHKLNALTANAKLTVKDSGETKGTIGTLTAGNGLILGNLLADGYGFKKTDDTWVAETETSASNVAVQEAPLKNVTLAADNETVKYGKSQTVKLEVSYETVGEGSASQTWYAVAEDGTATLIENATESTYTLPAGVSAGTYTYRVTVSKDGYSRSVDIVITVEKLDLKDAAVVLKNNGVMMFFPDIFSGAGTEVTQNVESVTIDGIALGEADYIVTGNVQQNAGSYKLTITAADDSVNFIGSIKVDWTIRAHKLSSVMIKDAIKNYDGTAELPDDVVTGMFVSAEEKSDYSAGAVKLSEGKDYKLSDMTYDSPDAGDNKTISYTIELINPGYIFDDGTMTKTFRENSTTSVGLEFKINKVDAEAIEAPAAKNLTYNGEEQQLVTAGTANGGTMQYSLNGVDYSNVIPTGKDAATYTVYYKVVGDKNHNDTIAQSVEVTIGKAAVTVKADNKSSRVGKDLVALTYTCTPGLFGDDTANGALATTANKDTVNTYPITRGSLTLSENYDMTFEPGTYTVEAKIIPTVDESTLSASAITYGQALSESTITGTMKDGDTVVPGTFAWVDGTTLLNAGSHEVSWTFTPDDTVAADYAEAIGKVEITVNPKSIADAAVTLNQNSFEYDTTEKMPIVTGVELGGTMLTDTDYDVTVEAQTDVGDYTVTVKGKGNYTGEAMASWTITPKTVTNPTIELTDSFPYTGDAIEPAVTVKDGTTVIPTDEYEVSYKDNTNAGTATVTIADKEGGNYTVSGSKTFQIEKVDSEVSAAPAVNELTYNGSEQPLVTAGTAKGGTMQYSLNGEDYSNVIPIGKDAATYTVYYKVVGDKNHNDTIAKSVEVTIGKAAVTVTADDKSSRVGKDLVALTYTCAPGLFGDDAFTGELATTADKDVVNTYAITQGTLALSENYMITFVDGTYTVTAKSVPAVEEGTLSAAAITYGQALSESTIIGVMKDGDTVVSGIFAWVDGTMMLNAGSHEVSWTFTPDDTADYEVATGKVEVTVNPRSIEGATVTLNQNSFEYNTTAQAPIVTGVKLGDTMLNTADYSVSVEAQINVGNYTVTVTGKGNYTGEATARWTIAPKTVTNPAIELTGSFSYTGEAIEPAVTVKDGGTVIPVGEYEVSYKDNTNAGVATVTITDKEGGNYTVNGSTTFQIEKVDSEVTAAPTANELTYNGSEQELVTAGAAKSGTMQYSLNGEDYSNVIPTGKDAGTYTVYYKVVGDKNHNDTIAKSVEVTIEKAAVTVKADDKSSRVGKALEELTYTYSLELFGNDAFTGTLATTADKDVVNTYAITQGTLALSENYRITFVDGTYTVTAKSIPTVVEGTLSVTEITYGQSLSESTITGTMKDGDTVVSGTFAWVDGTVMLDSGRHEVSWIFTPENTADYEVATGKVKVTVNPRSIEGATVTLNQNSFEYDTTEKMPTVTGVELGGTTLNTAAYSVSVEAQINAGDYTVTVNGEGNYTGTAMASWTITPKTVTNPTIELKDNSFPYTGDAIEPAVTVKDGETEIPASEYEVSYKDNINVGTATVIVADKKGGNYTVSGSTTFQIEKVDSEVTAAPTANELTYNGSEQPLVTAGTAKGGTMQYSLNGEDYSDVIPTGKDAKTYTVYYKVVGDKNHNDTIAKSVEVTIGKAAVTVTADNKSSRVGKDLVALTYTCTPGLFGGDTASGALATTADKDVVNTYAITQGTLALSENYKITFIDGTYTVTAKSVPAVEEGTLSATAITYGQALSESTITGTVKDDDTVVSGTFTWVDGTMMLNAGSHEVSWTFTPDDTADYEVATGKVKVTVNPRSIEGATVTLNQNSFEYNTTAQAPIVTGVKLGDTMLNTADYNVTVEAQTNVGNYTVTVTGKGNYTDTATASWTITPKTVTNPTIELTGSFSYTGEAIEPAVTVKDGGTVIPVGEYEVSYKDNTNAGTATVIVADKEGGNYTVNGSTTFQIEKVDSEATAAPTANELTYNGSEQPLVTAGTAKGGTMQYSLNGVDYSDVIPTGKDAGTYTVYYKVVGDKNHNDTIAKSVEVTIEKAAVTVKADDKSSRVGKALEELTYTYSPELFGNDAFTGTLATTADKDVVDTYAITQGTLALSNNYTITFVPGTYTVEAKLEQSGFKFFENTQTRTYGDADFTVSADGMVKDSTVTYSSSNTDVATVDNNGKVHILKAGSTVITARASEMADYLEATASYTLTVAKKSITAPVADTTVFTYNGKAQTYKLTAGEGYAISGSLTETNANENGYLITVSLTDKQNTKWAGSEDDVADKSFRFVIHKAAVSVTAKDRSAYVGDTAPALPAEAVKGTDYTVSGLFDEDALSGTVTLTYAGTPDMTKEGIASINISGTLANDNYTVSYVPGKLTIVNRPSSGDNNTGNTGSGTTGDSNTGNTGSGTTGDNNTDNTGSGTTGDNNTGNTGSGTTGDSNTGNTGSGTTGGSNTGNTGSGTTGNNGAGNTGSGTTGGNGSGNTGSGTTSDSNTSNTGSGTTGDNGSGNTGSGTTSDSNTGNTGSDTTETETKPATGADSDTSKETTPAQINVIISRGENTVQIAAKVNENIVTVDTIDFDKLDDVLNGTDDVVTIDISKIESDKTIDTVELSAEVVNKLAENNVDVRLAVVRGGTAIELDVKALSKKLMQADDSNLILSIKEVTDNMPTLAQMQTIGQRPAFDINLFSGDVRISAMGKEITIRVPYQLAEGETAEGIKVYYVDDEGNKEPCETFYDEAAGCVSWKTTHLSIYMIDYEAAVDEVLADEAPAANGSNIVLWIVLGVVVLAAAVAIAAVINSRKKQEA